MGDAATVPSRLLMKRSIAAAAWFNFTMGSAFLVLIYYLPIWFQAVKGTSAVESGIYNLPLILGLVLVSILIGIGVTVVGYYAPFMIAASAITSIAIGLMTTFTPESAANKWIGYQAMAGIGIGFGIQQPLVVVQTVLPLSDVPIGTALMYFLQVLGGSIFVSVGQNVFTNKLKAKLLENVPGLDPDIVLSAGATSFQHSVAPKYLPLVISAYNDAITRAFLVATLMACLTIMGSLLVEWKNVKAIKKPGENGKSQKMTEKADGA
ncbi:DHA14-like major facilitator [Metarhizium guizhouense ARSEF 977]|uniref:DHA14-like major facilitator n=1 Tax=Metarhizium guizhouense (strain ARSEF 977) TaxID=1276136 RepID=A0A0B4GNN2_METGA|nr:DHA14-like major facilitator [Metarhizium guizhouense ARSEF 977]